MTKSFSISQATSSPSIVPVLSRAFGLLTALFKLVPSSCDNRLSSHLRWDIGLLDVNPATFRGRGPKSQSQTAADEMTRRAF